MRIETCQVDPQSQGVAFLAPLRMTRQTSPGLIFHRAFSAPNTNLHPPNNRFSKTVLSPYRLVRFIPDMTAAAPFPVATLAPSHSDILTAKWSGSAHGKKLGVEALAEAEDKQSIENALANFARKAR